jgi:hypothetical protein
MNGRRISTSPPRLNLLRARSDHIGFTAIGIELAEDCEVGVAGVDSRIGIRPLGICRHSADTP